MRCQRCPKPATLHLTEIVGTKQIEELHFCEECAQKHLYEPGVGGSQPLPEPKPIDVPGETDNLEAEAARLEALGAKRIAFVRDRWWVMEAPTGHRFCVVHKQRDQFGPNLNLWDP